MGHQGTANEPELRPVSSGRRLAGLRTTWALMLREMSTAYGKSWGGYLWAIVDPVGGIVLMTVVFSLLLRAPPIGTNFAIFYATGFVPFTFYMTMNQKMAQSVSFSKALLAYPAVTFIDALVARALVTMLTGLLVSYLIFSFLLLTQETRTDPQVFQILLSFAMAAALGIGVGVLNCFLFAAFPDWVTIWGILNRPLFIISCVFFIFDNIPHPYDAWLWWNPLIHVVGQMRKGFYSSYPGDYVSPAYVFAVSGVLTVIGLCLLLRYHREMLNEW